MAQLACRIGTNGRVAGPARIASLVADVAPQWGLINEARINMGKSVVILGAQWGRAGN